MTVSSFTSLSRENLIRLVGSADFFTRNPALQQHEEAIKSCREAYAISKKNSSCSCGGNTKLFTPCLEALLGTLEELKENNPAAIATFVNYVTSQPVGEKKINVAIYYTKNNGTITHRYDFRA